jgi:hypothetical protein
MSKGRSLKEGEADSICDIVAFKISKGEGLGSKELYINGVCAFRQKKLKKICISRRLCQESDGTTLQLYKLSSDVQLKCLQTYGFPNRILVL